MKPKTTIQAELEAFLKRNGKTINQFAGISGVNSGTLSSIINGNRPIAMQQLDRITAGMGLEEGSFYELYIDECMVNSTPDWRRLGPFLHRCAELDKLECIRPVILGLMDNVSYAQALFDTAEHFFGQGRLQAAALLYEGVAESEKYQHSERLALCQYRMFTIALGEDQDSNLRAATHFEYFVERLDETDQLDALHALAKVYASLHRWSKVEMLAEEMGRKASIQYQNRNQARRKPLKEPQEPLFFYILYADLLRAAVCHVQGDYGQAIRYAARYSETDWIREDSETAQQMKQQFREWAAANTYLHRLMAGQAEVLPEFAEYIAGRADEILPGLILILQAANRYNFNADEIISRFQNAPDVEEQAKDGILNLYVAGGRHNLLLCELAAYYLNSGRPDQGIAYTLRALESSVEAGSGSSILRCVGWFEEFRHLAGAAEQETYKNLLARFKEAK
ncbi:transcriptional regulator [Paenibacillus sp. PK3_47]|uniref:helix-turn-helix domain-containing protein n=1 Tax=Paenibacillus sp. PK3_47 TaxID=2072642 RepID=UPI00201D7C88|nr:helix-turn-helix transcriptional regulator [Paenibacillus sp. PK3_47]UQZ37609.1 transcriptional regulator [Paenibacillus sp. PK3_47]